MNKVVFWGLILLTQVLKGQQIFQEFVDSEYLKTITLYAYSPNDDFQQRYTLPAVVNLNASQQQLFLEFDDIRGRFSQYKARIVHCEPNWQQSRLLDSEFLNEINELYIEHFQVSQNTKIPYYHYQFAIPKPKISGNFILQLFESEELVLQRKFWVYENAITVETEIASAQDPEFWKTHQQVNLRLDLGNYRVGIPQRELQIFIRKNQSEIKEVKTKDIIPSGRNAFTLQQFSNEYLFPGGNEFRFLDITSSFRRGQNVAFIQLGRPDRIETYVQEFRSNYNYADSYDNDGAFIVSNSTLRDVDISSDYVDVQFRLINSPFFDDKTPVIMGKLTQGEAITLEPNDAFYEVTLPLKNGVYDFQFGWKNELTGEIKVADIEGNFNQTGNTYEVFVYHIIPGNRQSKLIGYQINKRPR